MVYGFLLEFFSSIVPKTHRFWDTRLQKYAVTLQTGLWVRQGHWKCHHMRWSAYNFLLTFYSNYGSILCRFWDIQCRKMSCYWNRGERSLKVIERGTIRYTGNGFLLVFYRNFVPISRTVFEIFDLKVYSESDLETRVSGHPRPSKIIPFNPAPMTSYIYRPIRLLIITMRD